MASAVQEKQSGDSFDKCAADLLEFDIQNAKRIAEALKTDFPSNGADRFDYSSIVGVGSDVAMRMGVVIQQYQYVSDGNEILNILQRQIDSLPADNGDPSICQKAVEWIKDFCATYLKPYIENSKCDAVSGINEKELLECAAKSPKKALEKVFGKVMNTQTSYLENMSTLYALSSFGSMIMTCYQCVKKANEIANIKVEGKSLDDLKVDLVGIREKLDNTWIHTCKVIDAYSNQGIMPATHVLSKISIQYQEIRNDLISCTNKLERMDAQVTSEANSSWWGTAQSAMGSAMSFTWLAVTSQSMAYKSMGTLYKAFSWAPGACNVVNTGANYYTYRECKNKLEEIRKELIKGKELHQSLDITIQKYEYRLVEMQILMQQGRQGQY